MEKFRFKYPSKKVFIAGARMAHPQEDMNCVYCGKPTKRRSGRMLHALCPSCATKYETKDMVFWNLNR